MSDLPQFPLPESQRSRSQFPSGGFGQQPSVPPPPNLPRPTPPPRPQGAGLGKILAILAGVVLLALVGLGVGAWLLLRPAPSRSGVNEDAIVRVVTGDVRGTGFFVQAPSGADGAYVVTAFHVVAEGGPVTIERRIPVADHSVFVEAYPDTELAAFDEEADLAVIHVKNVPSRRFPTLPLADAPVKNEPVVSAGFPPIGVARKAELSTRPGRVDQLVKLDAVDRLMGKVIAANKVEGLLVDTNLEPGFSGGPTVNAAGEVVGVNVLKDTIHRGQDGAVSVVVLRELMKKIKPFTPPAPADAEALLKKTQEEYMVLPVDDRAGVSPTPYIGVAELPAIREMISAMRSMDGDRREHEVQKGVEVSNQALLGMLLARLPGKSLETYQASSTRDRIEKCEEKRRSIERFLGSIGEDGDGPHADQHLPYCDTYAVRPAAWDLVASTLEWSGAVRDYKVTKIEVVDEDARVYQASVLVPGVTNLLPIHMAWEAGALRIKLFDKSGRMYALQGARSATAHDFEGTWGVSRPRRAEAGLDGVESERSERIVVSISGTDAVSVAQEYTTQRFASKGAFRCNLDKSITTKTAQTLTGRLHNGVVTGSGAKFEYLENGCKDCKLCYAPDRAFVLKRYGDRLLFYRTDGVNAPEAIEMTRQ